jgi:predicted nucleic acid-binding protein
VIVFDASTAILLAKAGMLDEFVNALGQEVLMPAEVRDDCCGRDSLDAKLIARAISEGRILVKPVRQRSLVENVKRDFGLGVGEAAAIGLAGFLNEAIVATDDKRAINACKVLRLPFTTALSVLIRMREKALLDRQEAIAKLELLARYGRYKKESITAARAELEG